MDNENVQDSVRDFIDNQGAQRNDLDWTPEEPDNATEANWYLLAVFVDGRMAQELTPTDLNYWPARLL